jgi:hypothetical protein
MVTGIAVGVVLACMNGFLWNRETLASEEERVTKHSLLERDYHEGEKLTYEMNAKNEGRQYEILADGIVKKDAAGVYFEEFAWSKMTLDGAAVALPPTSAKFRQKLSLDLNYTMTVPDLSQTSPILVGPITDLLTFYSDLWLAAKTAKLQRAGDHCYVPLNTPNSWADGNYVLLGQDSIDFDLTLESVNETDRTALLVARHVPPKEPKIKIPAEWMRAPVADTANNWVEIERKDGKYIAEIGKETFEARIKVNLPDGKILSATMDNPVVVLTRECADVALTNCGEGKQHLIRRQIELRLQQ